MKKIKLGKNSLKETIKLTIETLKSGGLIIAPSDTVYGVLVDATNKNAVKKLIQFKNRPIGKPISVFLSDFKMLVTQVEVSPNQKNLLKELLPGPFTVVLQSKHKVNKLLESEKGTLGARIVKHSFIKNLLREFKKPTTATSANLSGRSPHYSIQTLLNELPKSKKKLIDLIIDAGQLPRNKPSTIIDLTEPKIKILRKGDIVFNSIKKYTSESPVQTKKIAQYILEKAIDSSQDSPLIFILQGDLGVGKTIFVKGIAEYLGINNVVSPTFVIYYDYDALSHSRGVKFNNKLVHIDLYNIEVAEEFKYLGLEKYLKPKNVLCFEWGEKAGEILEDLKSKGKIIYVKLKYVNEKVREISIKH